MNQMVSKRKHSDQFVLKYIPDTDSESSLETESIKWQGDKESEKFMKQNFITYSPIYRSRRNRSSMDSDIENPGNESHDKKKYNFFIYYLVIVSSISGFLFGYDTGIVSGSMIFIKDTFQLTHMWQEAIVSSTILSAWITSIIAGFLANSYGRKFVIIIASISFTITSLWMAFSSSKEILLSNRLALGIAIGLSSVAIPVHIAEVAPDSIRGTCVTFSACCIPFGQFIASIVSGIFSSNEESGWRWMLGLASLPAAIQLVLFFWIPESPRWLIMKGKDEEALISLATCRGKNSWDVWEEFVDIKNQISDSEDDEEDDGEDGEDEEEEEEEKKKGLLNFIKSRRIAKALLTGCLIMMFQQLAGINTVMYYSATIIQMSGVASKSAAVWLSSITSFINFAASLTGLLFVEKFGRRPIYLLSMLGTVIALLTLSRSFYLSETSTPLINSVADPESRCSKLSDCHTCTGSQDCGFCFQQPQEGFSLFRKPEMTGSCVRKDPNNNQFAHNESGHCSKDSLDSSWVWAPSWCPSQYSSLILLGLCGYLLFFAPGMGVLSWTITSEIFPQRSRSLCFGITTSTNWFFNLLVSSTFLTVIDHLTPSGAYLLYAVITASGLIIFFFLLPETKGVKLESTRELFRGSILGLDDRDSLDSLDLKQIPVKQKTEKQPEMTESQALSTSRDAYPSLIFAKNSLTGRRQDPDFGAVMKLNCSKI